MYAFIKLFWWHGYLFVDTWDNSGENLHSLRVAFNPFRLSVPMSEGQKCIRIWHYHKEKILPTGALKHNPGYYILGLIFVAFHWMYWPGVHSCHRDWRTSAKSSCPRGGWWPVIGPSGSSASPPQYADNPGGNNTKITRDRQVKYLALL